MDPTRFRDCACPGTPHPEGDTVTFRPRLPFEAGLEAIRLIYADPTQGNASKAWPVYLREGPLSWNLLDEDGDPVELSREALEALDFADQYEIGDKADDLYGGQVLAPLLRRMKTSSGTGRTSDTPRRRATRSPSRRSAPEPSS